MRVDTRNNGVLDEFQAEIRLGQVHSNGPEGDYVIIEAEDDKSGIRFLSIKVPKGQVANLFLHKQTEVTVSFTGLALVGCDRQVKYEFVPGSPSWNNREADTKAALAPFEVDGWKGSTSDYGNGHRHKKKDGVDGYNVGFVRFVRPDGTPVL